MKLRITDRILVAVAGLLLIACCAGIVAQMFFGVDLIGVATKVFSSDSARVRTMVICAAVLLLLLGVYCFLVLFRHRSRRDKFILQKNESGELAISVKALENMVQKCLEQHDEIKVQNLYLENKKDGLLIRIRGSVAGGISIPLTVEALQKQIRQYVTACSGVEIKGIRVQIESSGEDAKDAPFAIAPPAAKPLLQESKEKQNPVQNTETVRTEEPATSEVKTEIAETVPDVAPEIEDDDRPLHQRLFSTKPEPCIVPEPPAEAEIRTEEKHETGDATEENHTEEGENSTEETEGSSTDIQPEAEPAGEQENVPDEETEAVQEQEEILPETEDEGEPAPQDTEFLESLKAFDEMVKGDRKESET